MGGERGGAGAEAEDEARKLVTCTWILVTADVGQDWSGRQFPGLVGGEEAEEECEVQAVGG